MTFRGWVVRVNVTPHTPSISLRHYPTSWVCEWWTGVRLLRSRHSCYIQTCDEEALYLSSAPLDSCTRNNQRPAREMSNTRHSRVLPGLRFVFLFVDEKLYERPGKGMNLGNKSRGGRGATYDTGRGGGGWRIASNPSQSIYNSSL